MFIVVYMRLYTQALLDAVASIAKNAWTLVLPIALVLAWVLLAALVSPLGMVGGFLLAFARAALLSVYSYFLVMLVTGNKASVSELKKSLGAYFYNWLSFSFVLFMISLGLDIATKHNPDGRALLPVVGLMELVVLNAAPETIYLKGTGGGIETITRSFRFLQENWIEWFVPNGVLLALGWLVWSRGWFLQVPGGALGLALIGGVLLHLVAVFRGFLYELLDGSTHRQRMFKFKNPR